MLYLILYSCRLLLRATALLFPLFLCLPQLHFGLSLAMECRANKSVISHLMEYWWGLVKGMNEKKNHQTGACVTYPAATPSFNWRKRNRSLLAGSNQESGMVQTQSFQEPLTATPEKGESVTLSFCLWYGKSRPGHSPCSLHAALHSQVV